MHTAHEDRTATFPECPIRNILARISDKWSMLVLYTLHDGGVMRFGELRRNIPDISQKVLTGTLRKLEEDGYIIRTTYPEVPPRVEYALSERGESFIPCMQQLLNWAALHMEDILRERTLRM